MIDKFTDDPKEVVFRVLSIILSSIFFSQIPLLLFLIYMGHHGFFSYDFFSDGVFGLKVFFFMTSIIILLMAFATFWWTIPLIEKWKMKRKLKLKSFVGITILNVFFLSMILLSKPENNNYLWILFLLSISLFVCVHIGFLLYATPKDQFRSLTGVIGVITTLSVMNTEQSALALGLGLKVYGMGGGVYVTLKDKLNGEESLSGKLLLMSPENIYIKLTNSEGVSTISRSKYSVITENSSSQRT